MSLEDCFNTFDELLTPWCPSLRIYVDEPIHLCATSLSGDICNGDAGGALAALDKDNK